MKYLIGVDIGTSGTKSALFDTEGNLIADARREYPLHQPKNGYAEQNPHDWKKAVFETLRELTDGIDASSVVGVGLTGQMHGLVLLDEKFEVIRPAILWCDGRSGAECREISLAVGERELVEITANPPLAGFTASKILWVKKHEPENYARCRHILLPKDYIRFLLTSALATDASDASGTQLLDVGKRQWSDIVLSRLDIDAEFLPRVFESPSVTGIITASAAGATGLKAGTPVVAGAGDNAAAAVGTGVVRQGRGFATIGTSGVVYAHTSKLVFDSRGRVHSFCCAVPDAWHVMGVTQAAGLSLKWFCDSFCENMSYSDADELAARVEIGSNGAVFLPYLMGERTPHLNPDARGVFFGLSAMHGKPELIRAVMEGVAFSLTDCLSVLREMRVDVCDMAVCGGGAKSKLWREMLASCFNMRIKRLTSNEGPALGAAILAGVGTGVYSSVESACDRIILEKDKISPQNVEQYAKYYNLYKKIYPNLKDCFNAAAHIK